jgi:hypothetical protein
LEQSFIHFSHTDRISLLPFIAFIAFLPVCHQAVSQHSNQHRIQKKTFTFNFFQKV